MNSIIDSLFNAQSRFPHRAAVIRGNKTQTFENLLRRSERVAGGLSGLGLSGSPIAILTPTADLPPLYYGVLLAGAIAVPVNYSLRFGEISSIFLNCRPDAFIVHADFLDEISRIDEKVLAAIRYKFLIGRPRDPVPPDFVPLSKLLMGPRRMSGRDEGAVIFHTSGTTGTPKGAYHTLKSASHFSYGYSRLFKGEDRPVTIIARNCYHSGGFYNLTGALSCGTSCVITDHGGSFDGENYLRDMKKHRATQIFVSVSMLNGILHARNLSPECFVHATFISAGADEVKPFHHERLSNFTDLPLSVRYSSTEATAITVNDSADIRVRARTIGRPFEHIEYKIAAQGDAPHGELLLRGKSIFREYYNNPVETRNAFAPDNWYRTGDLVREDADGQLIFLGRSRDMIKVSGKIVYPEEIETVAGAYGPIEESIAVAVPHEIEVHVPFLFIRLNTPGTRFNQADFLKYMSERIAGYKIPVKVAIVDSFPITRGLKVDRKALAEQAIRIMNGTDLFRLSA